MPFAHYPCALCSVDLRGQGAMISEVNYSARRAEIEPTSLEPTELSLDPTASSATSAAGARAAMLATLARQLDVLRDQRLQLDLRVARVDKQRVLLDSLAGPLLATSPATSAPTQPLLQQQHSLEPVCSTSARTVCHSMSSIFDNTWIIRILKLMDLFYLHNPLMALYPLLMDPCTVYCI